MATLDHETLGRLERFRTEVGALPNESAKTHRFMALVAELFSGSNIVAKLAGGIEKVVRIPAGHRRIDSYFGNAVIEFEKSLDVSLDTAISQLREQAAGLWNGEETSERPLLCIASDGLRWETYQATLKAPASASAPTPRLLGPEHVELEPLQTLRLTADSLSGFWLWLTGLLFRDQQVVPTAERFRLDFGALSPAYLDGIRRMKRTWQALGGEGEAKVAFQAWRRYLTVTYGQLADSGKEEASPETVELFLKHTFLAMIARLLTWSALSKGHTKGDFRPAITGALDGSYFRHRKIENLVESDFFQWAVEPRAAEVLMPAWEKALVLMRTYDLSRLSQDVLKGVYQELVDPKDRHDLGEYYTPEWLCERIVMEMMPDSGVVSVLDPTCGSGSFLRAAIAHLIAHNPETDRGELLNAILDGVVGIDIHPLAVTIARATYVLALGDLLEKARRPVRIPVYLADALFLPTEVQTSLLNGSEIEIRFGLKKDHKFYLPSQVLDVPGLFDHAMDIATRLSEAHALNNSESIETLRKALKRGISSSLQDVKLEVLATALWEYVDSLAKLILDHENSIWAFIIKNGYRPALLKDRFDLILGNPPWLSYRYIADPEYQAEVKKRAVGQYAIAPKEQKLFTQMELASVFLIHSLSTFGKEGARLAFVMPRGIMTADQHGPLRLRNYTADVVLTGLWDLFDVRPLFNVPSCVLIAKKSRGSKGAEKALPTLVWEGDLGHRNLGWVQASERLKSRRKSAKLVRMGTRSALTTLGIVLDRALSSTYLKQFHQGATIVPRNFYFVEVNNGKEPIHPGGIYWANTDPEQAKEAKAPYKDILMRGEIEAEFLFRTAISKNVLPFAVIDLPMVILPVVIDEKGPRVWKASELKDEGLRDCGDWMKTASDHWDRLREKKADRQSVYQRLDYQKGLTSQDLSAPHLVLYNAAGTNISAAVFSRKECPQTFFVEHKLYYFTTNKRSEAHYLAAVLNSSTVNLLIKPFQSVGLMGERDIEKKVLELPIPLFDDRKPEHLALAKLGEEARKQAAIVIASAKLENWPGGLARRRAIIRKGLGDVLDRIDQAVKQLFGVAD